jgi:hypothetical protein
MHQQQYLGTIIILTCNAVCLLVSDTQNHILNLPVGRFPASSTVLRCSILFGCRSNEQLGQAQARMAELEQLLAASNAALATAQV